MGRSGARGASLAGEGSRQRGLALAEPVFSRSRRFQHRLGLAELFRILYIFQAKFHIG